MSYKEQVAVNVASYYDDNFILHDDKILLRAEKVQTVKGRRKEFPLKRAYRSKMWGGQVSGYEVLDVKTNDKYWVDVKKPLPADCLPTGKESKDWWLDLTNKSKLLIKHNEVIIVILGLYQDLQSRYKMALDRVIEMYDNKIIDYKPRVKDYTKKNIKESLRQTLKRSFKVAEYEHNILFLGELSEVAYKEAEKIGERIQDQDNTLYLFTRDKAGVKIKEPSSKVKVYNPAKRDGLEGAVIKFEVTLLKGALKKKNHPEYREPQYFLEQPDIQKRIKKNLISNLKKFITGWEKESKEMLRTQLNIRAGKPEKLAGNLAKALLSRPENTLTKRMEKVEKDVAILKRDMALLKSKKN